VHHSSARLQGEVGLTVVHGKQDVRHVLARQGPEADFERLSSTEAEQVANVSASCAAPERVSQEARLR